MCRVGSYPVPHRIGYGDQYGVVPALRELSLHREAEEKQMSPWSVASVIQRAVCWEEAGDVIVSAECDSPFSYTRVLSMEHLNYTWHVAGRGSMGRRSTWPGRPVTQARLSAPRLSARVGTEHVSVLHFHC